MTKFPRFSTITKFLKYFKLITEYNTLMFILLVNEEQREKGGAFDYIEHMFMVFSSENTHRIVTVVSFKAREKKYVSLSKI